MDENVGLWRGKGVTNINFAMYGLNSRGNKKVRVIDSNTFQWYRVCVKG